MEQNGIVYTFFDNKSRSKTVKLTEQAIPLSKDMEETISKNDNEMLNGLSDSEIEQMEKSFFSMVVSFTINTTISLIFLAVIPIMAILLLLIIKK